MGACAARYFETELSGYDLREGELWQHAVATAMISETVARGSDKRKALIAGSIWPPYLRPSHQDLWQ
jgi:HD-like signal output (HDOD) protein